MADINSDNVNNKAWIDSSNGNGEFETNDSDYIRLLRKITA
jgi:hypothetical protein